MARTRRSERRPSGRLGSPRARLFLALELPEDARAAIARWRDEALAGRDALRPVRAEALHVTLVFLGYRPEREIPDIAACAATALAGLAAPLLAARAMVAVPVRRPRLYALDLADLDESALAAHRAASEALESAGHYRPERRPFWAHLTLARVKARRRPAGGEPRAADRLAESGAAVDCHGAGAPGSGRRPPSEPFRAREAVLYRSILEPSGARYEALERVSLR